MNTRSCLGTLSLAGLLAFLAGCPNPQTYGTPRTLDPGKWQVVVAAEAFGVSADTKVVNPNTGAVTNDRTSYYFPNLPSAGARVGLADRVDFGFGLKNLYSPTLDLKVNFLKTKYFDMSVAPMINYIFVAGGSGSSGGTVQLFYFHVPLLLGINFTENVSLVLTPGFVYGLAVGTGSASNATGSFLGSAPWLRFGGGVNIRVNRKIALQPEITMMKSFSDQTANAMALFFGFGVSFLNQPDYSEDWTGKKAVDD